MSHSITRHSLRCSIASSLRRSLCGLFCLCAASCLFVGSYCHAAVPAGWLDLKRDYTAVGDGIADDSAAIQRAFDDLRPDNRQKFVLHIPAGRYRITRTLNVIRTKHAESQEIAILGHDPADTALVWDGPDGGVMLDYAAWYARLGRLTFDGRGKAATAIAHGKPFVTFNELADLEFRDVGIGIEAGAKGGNGIAETAVLRCRFIRCAKAGVSIQNFNSLDWWLWRCRFEDCGTGVTNTFGAGNFHVYDSQFLRSKTADASIGNTEYFSLRNNVSIGSKAFFVAGGIGASGNITLERNRIADPLDVPVQIGNNGPLVLFDNVILRKSGPAVRIKEQAGLISAGNTFTTEPAITGKTGGVYLGDRVVAYDHIEMDKRPAVLTPAEPATFTEVAAGADGDAIQQAIDLAAKDSATVHLPAGTYRIARPLRLPAEGGVRIIGDGGHTRLSWTGDTTGPVVSMPASGRATMSDLSIDPAGRADGIHVVGCDAAGPFVTDQLNVSRGKGVGLLADGLARGQIILRHFEHSDCAVGVRAIGTGEGKPAGRLWILGGASSTHELTYDVQNGGRIVARDIWYETGKFPRFMNLTGSGEFVLHGSKVAVAQKGDGPAILLDGFRGRAAFLTTTFVGTDGKPAPVVVRGDTSATDLLLAGVLTGMGDGAFSIPSGQPRAAMIESCTYTPGGGSRPTPDVGAAPAKWLESMLSLVREQPPVHLDEPVRLHRVMVGNATNGVVFRP
ncbi:MAG: glycosyl hydrolase family 28-related protein [Tepidisphaerales bacterium]